MMSSFPDTEIVVLDIAGVCASVQCGRLADSKLLLPLGFTGSADNMTRLIRDTEDRRNLVRALIKINAIFSGGRGWSPKELVEYYCEQGIVKENYRTITWRNPSEYVVVEARRV